MPFTADTIEARESIKMLLERLDWGALDKLDHVNLMLNDFKAKLFNLLGTNPSAVDIEKAIVCYEMVAMEGLQHCFALMHRFARQNTYDYAQLANESELHTLDHLHSFSEQVIKNTKDLVSGETGSTYKLKKDSIYIKKELLHKMICTWSDKALLGAIQVTKDLEFQYISGLSATELIKHLEFLKEQRLKANTSLSLLRGESFGDRTKRINLYDSLMVMVDTALGKLGSSDKSSKSNHRNPKRD